MKYRSGLLFLFGPGCMGLLATPATASKENYVGYFDCSTEVIVFDQATGELTIQASLESLAGYDRICEVVSFGIVNINGLQVLSPLTWELPRGGSLAPLLSINRLIVQPGDTAGFGLASQCDTWYVEWPQFFALLGDSVAVYPSDPRTWPPLDVPPSEEEATRLRLEHWERAHAEWKQRQRDLDTIPPDGFQYTEVLLVDLADSAFYDSLGEMRLREREPLLDDEREIRFIEGRAFQRFRGERVFQRARTFSREEIARQTRNRFDSLHAAWADQPRDIIVDLRDSADSVLVRSLVDTLIPTDSASFYRTTIRMEQLRDMEEHETEYRNAAGRPREYYHQPRTDSAAGAIHQERDTASREATSISADSALAIAVKVLLGEDNSTTAGQKSVDAAIMTIMHDSTTPFLSDSLNGRSVWSVEVTGSIPPDRPVRATNSPRMRSYTVYLDAMTGIPLKIRSATENFVDSAWHKLQLHEAERQMLNGEKKYTGFPPHLPLATFDEALSKCACDVFSAEETVGVYVLYSHFNQPPVPIWDIHMFGVQTIMGMEHPEWPRYVTDHWRLTVDATTGEHISEGNLPGPGPDPELLNREVE